MIDHIKQSRIAQLSKRTVDWLQETMAPALLRRRIIGLAVIASLLAAVYWLLIASDRYVSEAHVIVQRTDLGGGMAMDFSTLLGAAANSNRPDQLLLRDHLLSVDMLRKLDKALNLRAHYSNWRRDPLSRMWFEDRSMEWFHRHYRSRVSVEFDDYSSVLFIKAQGYDPETAHAITAMLVQEGERFMNQMAHSLAKDQVSFLEQQVTLMNERAIKTRQAMVDYQNKKGLASPLATAASISAIVGQLESQRAELETRRSALRAYLVSDHPSIVQLDQQVAAVENQLALEQARIAAPSGKATLNRTVVEYQRLEMEAQFAQDVYRTALVALEKGRVEATRNIKKVSVLQAPTQPEYPLEPRRFYNTLVFMLVALLLAGVVHLLAAIVRDHKD
jgi:capsular polysaccharide transport system permease protein